MIRPGWRDQVPEPPRFGFPSPAAIYRQEEDYEEGIMGCTILEVPSGPKPYARIWDASPTKVEWGWVLHPAAVKVWPLDG